jgi:hypothetical protein
MHYKEYAAIDEKLRSKGFANDIESGVICRYTIHGITVDVMDEWISAHLEYNEQKRVGFILGNMAELVESSRKSD